MLPAVDKAEMRPVIAPLPCTSWSASRIAKGLTQPSSVTGTEKRMRMPAMLPASSPVLKSPSPALANSSTGRASNGINPTPNAPRATSRNSVRRWGERSASRPPSQ